MTTTVTHSLVDCAQRVVKRDPVDELNETIAYYSRYPDEASRQQVRTLRRKRDGIAKGGKAPVTLACVTQD
jgi:hypothetical protein